MAKYNTVIRRKDGPALCTQVEAGDLTSAYWKAIERHRVKPDEVWRAEIDKLEEEYEIRLTETERQHFLTYWGHGQYHARLSNDIYMKVQKAEPLVKG